MKIDVHVSAFPVLSETFVLKQVAALVDRGHDVRVVVQRAADTRVVHGPVRHGDLLRLIVWRGDAYELMPRGKLKRLLKALRLLLFSQGVSRPMLLRCLNIARYGADAATLNLFFRSFHEARERFDTDVVLAHFGHNGEAFARAKHVGATRASLATVFHGYDLSRDIVGARNAYNYLFSEGELFLPVSNYWRERLVSLGCEPERIRVHRMGIDARELRRLSSRPPGVAAKRVLTVARFVEKKGLRYAVEAFEQVVARFIEAEYTIIGDGPLLEQIRDQIANAGLAERIRLAGPLDSAEVAAELARADVFLLPSVTASDGDQEGIPVVLMEAMAMELPVLSTYHSGIPELVDDGVSGYLVPERDSTSLADRLCTLLNDAPLRREMGVAGRRKVLSEYNLDELDDRLYEYLEELHCRSRRASR